MQIAQIKHKNRSQRTDLGSGNSFPSLNSFSTLGSQIIASEEIQKKAQQSLLDIEFDLKFQPKNPQAEFMASTRHIKLNGFQSSFRKNSEDHDGKFILARNKFMRTKSNLNGSSKMQKHPLIPTKIGHSEDEEKQIFKNTSLSKEKMQTYFDRTKSNLLSPRQNFPTICSADSQYITLAKRTRSSLKPYSFEKTQRKVRISPLIKLRDQLSMFPSIEKELRRKRIVGYE